MNVAERIVEEHAGWPGPFVEDEIFGTHDPEAVEQEFAAFSRTRLGSEPAEALLYEASVGAVAGLRLHDGREVVVKAHRPNVPAAHLDAATSIQRRLADRGFRCPRPLLGPRPLGRGLATVEELAAEGERRDAHEPSIRQAMAEALARLVASAVDLAATAGLRPNVVSPTDGAGLWPEPHSRLFDFVATATGAEWIDEIARQAAGVLAERDGGPPVVGHLDWAVKHFRFAAERVSAIYDWDSLALAEEAVIVGHAARGFTMTWYLDVPVIPAVGEARAFVDEYEQARRRRFSSRERRRLGAAATYALAYTARCEACLGGGTGEFPPGSARNALSRHAAEFLAL